MKALVDSGAAGNFMDATLAEGLKIPSDPLPCPLVVTAMDGRPLSPATVSRLTTPLKFKFKFSFIVNSGELSFLTA